MVRICKHRHDLFFHNIFFIRQIDADFREITHLSLSVNSGRRKQPFVGRRTISRSVGVSPPSHTLVWLISHCSRGIGGDLHLCGTHGLREGVYRRLTDRITEKACQDAGFEIATISDLTIGLRCTHCYVADSPYNGKFTNDKA